MKLELALSGRGFTLKGVGQVHVARNVLAKVPKKFKHDVANDLRSIFYALSQEKAWKCLKASG